jgi:hypothetical protein
MGKKRKVNQNTQAYKNKIIRRLKKKLLGLWSLKVKEKAGNKCEVEDCSTGNALNSHHIENFVVNKELRYDLRNGICVCQSHHKFLAASCHKSFVFMYGLMTKKHPEDLQYLLNFKPTGEELTVEILEQKIKEMESIKFIKEEKSMIQEQQGHSSLPLEQE